MEKWMLTVSGLYANSLSNLMTILAWGATWFFSLTLLLSMVIECCLSITNLGKIGQILFYFTTQLSYVCKLSNFVYNRKRMLTLEEILKHHLFTHHDEQQNSFIKNAKNTLKMLSITFRTSVTAVIVFFFLFPFLDNDPENPLIVPGWFYVDIKKYTKSIVVFQIISLIISANINSTIDILTCELICLGSAQFEILKDRYLRMHEIKWPKKGSLDRDEVILHNLDKSTAHHYIILE